MIRSRRPTSTDVAQLAGVSRATVSYVLNRSRTQSIPQETRTKVLNAAEKLGYTPNAAAQALRAGASRLVLLAVRDLPYGRNLGLSIERLAELAAEHGLSLITWQASPGQTLTTTLGHLQPRIVLSLFPLLDEEIRALDVAGIPHATGTGDLMQDSASDLSSVIQVHHLAAMGHTRIGYLAAADADLAERFGIPRLRGARRGCMEAGIEPPLEASVLVPPVGREEDVQRVLAEWVADGVTAVACYNDHVAALVMRAARTLSLSVPHTLAVIGVDDDPISAQLDPPLTTVRLDMVAMSDRLFAAGMAADGTGEPPPAMTSTALELVLRESA